ncbi:MAG: diphosphate--fructose-6-phosphate 1-phosphotransferase [Chlamydiae bacterium CG10_big_fil_rev_8_21_14_0_10_42_34]|nr:MAG: diphosphate--fructose-6-phosphate 1-phosphotransferase [Chlamydiae bacterium CG10_big_fil_rev_8_21_14_0_10_42_34]
MNDLSLLQKKRLKYKPTLPKLLIDLEKVQFRKIDSKSPLKDLENLFPNTFSLPAYELVSGQGTHKPLKIGVVFSGGTAAGGHNVICAIFDTGAKVIGFLNGPSGIVENQSREIKDVSLYRNQGGFDLIGTGRTKIETEEQFAASLKTVTEHKLDGLVIIGGDDSNTNAALLAEYFLKAGCTTKVVGIPKTIDGDLRTDEIEISFGFDSACKTYAELIGNIERDALSTKKYYHFIKLMGRSASNIVLECALATRPNLALISEEKRGLDGIIEEIVNLVIERNAAGKDYGVILIPEGLIEFVPELNEMAKELNLEKDPHGNVQVSKIQTEKMIIDLVEKELAKKNFKGKFNVQGHFFGYEGRSCMPTNFDATYCYALGTLAALCIREELTGVICSIQNLSKDPESWTLKAVPIIQLMHIETRLGKQKPVIQKALVDVNGTSFIYFAAQRKRWQIEDQYCYPGPIQYFGDPDLCDLAPQIVTDIQKPHASTSDSS